MLDLVVPETEYWDEDKQMFGTTKRVELQLEHSLISLYKWESKYKKSFLNNSKNMANHPEEFLYYIKCMTITKVNDETIFYRILADKDLMTKIIEYIEDPMTATTFTEQQEREAKSNAGSRDVVTAEIIYYWMTQLQIPFTCEKWNLNRLMTLIKVCNIKQTPPKKMDNKAMLAQNRALNAARRAKHKTKG